MKNSSCILALATGSIGLLLSACATSPATPQAAQQAAVAQPPPVKTCQTDYATGSHYQQHTLCMTDEDENDAEQATQQTMSTLRSLNGSHQRPSESGGH